jgi:uncharacterized membrane protein
MKGYTPNGRVEGSRLDRAQAIVWAAVMFPFLLSIVGLAIDAGAVFDARRELQNVADGAARVGAMQIDQQAYRASSGSTVQLDAGGAQQVAATYISQQGKSVTATVSASTSRVVVSASQSVPTSFLRLVGIGAVQVSATATAEAAHGITQGTLP